MKAEQFIKDYTNHCSNEMVFEDGSGLHLYEPWITPEQALRAIEIAREEMIDKACEWLEKHKEHPFIGCEDPCLSGYLTDEFIEDFKKTMKDKL